MVLLILTLLGIASLRGGIMQERMAATIATRSMSFQVAEAGLRQAELIARDGTVTFPSSGCSAGRCAKVSGWATDGALRPEERRVGKACVRTCRSRGSPSH